MIGCSSSEADKAAQNLIEITEESSDFGKIAEAANKLSVELLKLSPSEQKAWKKKWDKKFEEASFDVEMTLDLD